MLVYALSAITLNHRQFFSTYFKGPIDFYIKEDKIDYTGTFAANAGPRMMAEQILSDLGFDGNHWVQESREDETLTIYRNDPITPRRITYTRSNGKLLVEREILQTISFLRRMHFRRGYQHNYLMDNMWALAVDLTIFSIIFWGISGIYMWWKLKAVRKWGTICCISGILLFLFFLITI